MFWIQYNRAWQDDHEVGVVCSAAAEVVEESGAVEKHCLAAAVVVEESEDLEVRCLEEVAEVEESGLEEIRCLKDVMEALIDQRKFPLCWGFEHLIR